MKLDLGLEKFSILRKKGSGRNRIYLFQAIAAAELLLFVLIKDAQWIVSLQLYKYFGLLSAVLAFVIGLMAFVKLFTRDKLKYLFMGAGFLGASVLDTYYVLFGGLPNVDGAWNWNPSLAYLAILLFISLIVSFRQVKERRMQDTEKFLIAGSFLLPLVLVVAFSVWTLSKENILLFSSVFFFLSLVGYFIKELWDKKYFEFFLVASLIVLFSSQAFFLSSSANPLDAYFVAAEVLRIVSYLLALIGLMLSSYNAFKLVTKLSKTQEARLLSSIENLPMGYLLTDVSGNIVITNSRLMELVGKQQTNLKESLEKLFDIRGRIKQVLKHKVQFVDDIVHFNDLFIRVFCTPITMEGDVAGFVLLFHDITEEKLLEKTKDDFIALASHELRTPVTTISGNSQLIRTIYGNKLNNDDLREMVDDISASSERLLEIIEEFLDVSRLEQKRIFFKKECFDVAVLIDEVVKIYQDIVNEKKLEISIENKLGGRVYAVADRIRTRQVLDNLIRNAVNFTQEGRVSIALGEKNKMLEVSVSDTGEGMSEGDRDHLFRKFQQIGQDILKHDSTKGVGLGLYISKMLVKKMGGEIYLVKTELGKGSTFAFTLPLGKK